MPSQIRSAYPTFPQTFTPIDFQRHYTLNEKERQLALANTRGGTPLLVFAILLKTCQHLGYFPALDEVPEKVVAYLRDQLREQLRDAPSEPLNVSQPTLYSYHRLIRAHLGIQAFSLEIAEPLLRGRLTQAAQTMNWVTDLINVAIEMLIKENYELPAYSTLERLAANVRTMVHNEIFQAIDNRMTDELRSKVRQLLTPARKRGDKTADWTRLKELPKRATLGHLRDLESHLEWLLSQGETEKSLAGVPSAKIKDFAAEARGLTPKEMNTLPTLRRQAYVLCLVRQSRVETRDHLVQMFIKRLATIEDKAQRDLEEARFQHRRMTERLVTVLNESLQLHQDDDSKIGARFRHVVESNGGQEKLREDCERVLALRDDNYLPFMGRYFKPQRGTLFRMLRLLELRATSQDQSITDAIAFILEHEGDSLTLLPAQLELTWTSELWRKFITVSQEDRLWHKKSALEMCVFSQLVTELKTGDVAVEGSEQFADYREQLLAWNECQKRLDDYCDVSGLPRTAKEFVGQLKRELQVGCEKADRLLGQSPLKTGPDGELILPRPPARGTSRSFRIFEELVTSRLQERTLLEILWDVAHHTKFTRRFGPLSGSDPKLKEANDFYVVTNFAYAVNLGPAQTAKHLRGEYPAQKIAYVNRHHMSGRQLDDTLVDVANETARFPLIYLWGSGKRAIADGTHFATWTENLVGEMHIRYGAYGGIGYFYVSDTYQALFSRFITCGTYEAIHILDLFLENKSDFTPDTIHADTHGQSAAVFGLARLLGVSLQPRIRDWKEVMLFRPDTETHYSHIDSLFTSIINWELIETHWQDLMQVVLSIQSGTILPSTLLRKLSSYSRKNKLYFAFRELGRVIRTVFLLEYISDPQLRRTISTNTNKIEAYNAFLAWLFFGDRGVIGSNSADEQQKITKHLTLAASAVILHNVIELTRVLQELAVEGHEIRRGDVEMLSPYITRHVKRFGEYVLDISRVPEPLDGKHDLPESLLKQEPTKAKNGEDHKVETV